MKWGSREGRSSTTKPCATRHVTCSVTGVQEQEQGADKVRHLAGYGLASGDDGVRGAGGGDAVDDGVVEGDGGGEVGEECVVGSAEAAHQLSDLVSIAADVVEIDDAHALLRLRLHQQLQAAR